MPRIRLRFRLRTLMMATAAGALVLGAAIAAVRLDALSSAYRARAADHASQESLFAISIEHRRVMLEDAERIDRENAEETSHHSGMERVLLISQDAIWSTQVVNLKQDIARYEAKRDWNAAMSRKYQSAASRPWLTVSPDHPEPPTRRPR